MVVSTRVGEEGLDISEVNHSIRKFQNLIELLSNLGVDFSRARCNGKTI